MNRNLIQMFHDRTWSLTLLLCIEICNSFLYLTTSCFAGESSYTYCGQSDEFIGHEYAIYMKGRCKETD